MRRCEALAFAGLSWGLVGCGLIHITVSSSKRGAPNTAAVATPEPQQSVQATVQRPAVAASTGTPSSASIALADAEAAAADDRLAADLPTAARVQQLIQGVNPGDTTARQQASFDLLENYIDQRHNSGLARSAALAALTAELLRLP
jgi:hypothetical protein